MINLLLTILCSTSIALILKYNDTKKGNALLLLSGNYFVASLISLVIFLINDNTTLSLESTLLGAFLGVVFLGSFFAFTQAVRIAGTAIATVSSRISLIVPVVLSIIIFNEKPGLIQFAGFVFVFVTLFLFYKSLSTVGVQQLNLKDYFYLLLVLFGVGAADFGMKIFEEWRPVDEKSFFLFVIFGSAFVYSMIIFFWQSSKFDVKSFARGNVLGIPNMLSSFFLIGALGQLSAIFVYPVTNIGIIILTAIGAFLFWREKLNKYGLAALAAGIISIILLSN
jgi:drug/metabolite transporter (DMT)-like permease